MTTPAQHYTVQESQIMQSDLLQPYCSYVNMGRVSVLISRSNNSKQISDAMRDRGHNHHENINMIVTTSSVSFPNTSKCNFYMQSFITFSILKMPWTPENAITQSKSRVWVNFPAAMPAT